MPDLPLVTVVTPCYNMGRFVQETIESVLSQDYPYVEYIVMDGGSTDRTVEVLDKYRGRLEYHSGPDGGAADAINRGFARSKGSILAYLNADDTYLPGAVSKAVEHLRAAPGIAMVYGNGYWVDEKGARLGAYPTKPFDAELLEHECFICQPAAFWRREAFEAAGSLNPGLQYTFDYDLWIRMARQVRMERIEGFLATSRMHKENKTVGARRRVLRETLVLLRDHFGYVPFSWVNAYCAHLVDGRDQFFEPATPGVSAYLLSLFLGLRMNAGHTRRYLREWGSIMTWAALARRWRDFSGRCF